MRKLIFILIFIFLFLAVSITSYFVFVEKPEYEKVIRVIDGDTFELENGKIVRLLGINAPEKGQKCFEEARERLKELVEGKIVRLEKDIQNKDKYGRFLRYVFVNKTFVNLLLVKEGYAFTYLINSNKYKNELLEAEKYARENKIGCLWKVSFSNCSNCI